jgi:hypothetical protein
VDARRLDHRADRAARDNARARARRAEQHPAGAHVPERLVRDGHAVEGHREDVLPRLIVALADGLGHLVGLAEPHAHVPRLIAHHHERREAKAPAALHHLGDAVDVDDPLL